MSDNYRFPDCMHALSAALHCENIAPQQIEISLPREEWWRLWCAVDRKYSDLLRTRVPDGRSRPGSFEYMGFKFIPREAA